MVRISNRKLHWDRMDGGYSMELTGSPSELVTIYGKINCPTESNNANRYLTVNAPMWVNLTNSEQFIISCCIVRTVKIVCLTVCWLFDWTASQLVEFLYWFCLTEYIIWNWKWCWFYCVTSVDAGKQVGGIRLDSSTVILLFFIYFDIWCEL